MYIFKGGSLAHRMTRMALLVSCLSLGTLMTAFLLLDDLSTRSLLKSQLATLADIAGQNSAAALSFSDASAAGEVLRALRAEQPIVSACLYDSTGRLFAEYRRQAGTGSCAAERLALLEASSTESSVSRPVLHHGELLGTIYMNSDLQDLRKRRDHLFMLSACMLLVALGVGGLSARLLQKKISHPIFDLAHAMEEVTATENFTARVPVSGNDEIAQLGRGFNTMLAEIERRRVERRRTEELQVQAFTDALTGLPNRRLFIDRLTQTLSLAERESRTVALLYIDLDGFKLVNDSLGHSIGDALLVQVAARFQARVRESDTLGRLGGDEFTVILTGLKSHEEGATVASALLEVLTEPFIIDGHQLTIGASIGISIFPDNATDTSTLMREADAAMYAAKRNGKNQARYFTAELDSLVRERLSLENELRAALAHEEIQVHYQPEFDVATGKLVRFEALARWQHPTLGYVPPDKFIPIAEESGIIVPLGAYVLAKACAEAARWQSLAPYPIQVAVNVSSIQFNRDGFVEEVLETLKASGLRAELLQLELTESVMLNGVHRSSDAMRRLKAHGVSFAIDDFGTGYSCLSYLPSLPFDSLKVDRSFVRDLALRPESEAIIHSLVTLAHNIGMRVIVEGIEKPEQLEMVKRFGGNEIQGYLLGRPTPNPEQRIVSLHDDVTADKPATRQAQTGREPVLSRS